MNTLFGLALLAMGATLAVLVVGLVFMAIGGKLDKKYSNMLMTWRVGLQAAAVMLICVLMYLKHS